MSILMKYTPTLLRSHISTISDINLPPSQINEACCVEIKLERTFFSLFETAFEIILVSAKKMGHQFMYLLSVSSFSITLVVACLCEVLNSYLLLLLKR